MEYLLLIIGIVLLVVGGDFLVKSAIGIATRFNISPLLIGVTIVSFGTSAPELFVSLQATLDGSPAIAIGNVVGSNIANIGLVLGLTVCIQPVVVNRKKYLTSWLVMLISSLMFFGFSTDGEIGFFEGLFLVAGLLAFISISISYMKNDVESDDLNVSMNTPWIITYLVLGALGLQFGSDLLISNAVVIATNFGISQFIIGVSVVALGTSLPELATSLIASYKGQNSISLGNLIGSNVFNVFAVLGITSLVKPIPVSYFLTYIDLPVMVGFVILVGLFMFLGKKMGIVEGLALIVAYFTYMAYSFGFL
jgi:cation:H+ antiporter